MQSLVEDRASEGSRLDFKRDLYDPRNDPGKAEWAKDVTALANTAGGTLFFGIREEDGTAVEVCGVPSAGLDQEASRLTNLLHTWTSPRVAPNVDITTVDLGDGRAVMVVEVQRSWARPHAVLRPGQHAMSFYRRASRESLPLDPVEVAELIRESQSLPSRLDAFHADRVAAVAAGEMPFPLASEHHYVFTVTPWRAMRPNPVSLQVAARPRGLLRSMSALRPTLEGLAEATTAEFLNEKKPVFEQAQLHRTGPIEFVGSLAPFMGQIDDGRDVFSYLNLEWVLVEHACAAFEALNELEIEGPVSAGLTLLGVRGLLHFAGEGRLRPRVAEVRRPTLHVPRVDVLDRPPPETQPVAHALRPMFDILAQAMGYLRSRSFQDDGTWNIHGSGS